MCLDQADAGRKDCLNGMISMSRIGPTIQRSLFRTGRWDVDFAQ